MEKNNIKIYLLGVISAIVLILAVIGVISLFNTKDTTPLPAIKNMYATVLKTGNGEIVVDPIDEEIDGTYTVKVDYDFEVGDFVLVDGDKVTLIAKNDNFSTTSKVTDTTTSRTTIEQTVTTPKTSTTTKVVSDTTNKKTTAKKTTTTTKKVTATKKTTTKKANADSEVISYVESASNYTANGNASDETFGQKAKRYFITVVDFIFYDGEIKGYKWDELTTSAKAKVVYYALKIDSKIDEKFPDYKNTISTKYNDIKAKLVAKYLDITNTICSNSDYDKKHCDIVKQDFELLKKSVGITWDIVVDAFKYAYDKSASYLKTWYETFSGK